MKHADSSASSSASSSIPTGVRAGVLSEKEEMEEAADVGQQVAVESCGAAGGGDRDAEEVGEREGIGWGGRDASLVWGVCLSAGGWGGGWLGSVWTDTVVCVCVCVCVCACVRACVIDTQEIHHRHTTYTNRHTHAYEPYI